MWSFFRIFISTYFYSFFLKNLANDEDLQKILHLTEELCAQQSDWTIFWRFRVLVLEQSVESQVQKTDSKWEISAESENKSEISAEHNETDLDDQNQKEPVKKIISIMNILKRDLSNTFHILSNNPKSYSTWSHRREVLNLIAKLDEEEGLKLSKAEISYIFLVFYAKKTLYFLRIYIFSPTHFFVQNNLKWLFL